jgi:hypothetical protein
MNVEFVAIIVGLGMAIVLAAVVAELMVLRSSINRSAAAVKGLVAEAHEGSSASVLLAEMADPQAAIPEIGGISAKQTDLLAPLERDSRGPFAMAEPLQRTAETRPLPMLPRAEAEAKQPAAEAVRALNSVNGSAMPAEEQGRVSARSAAAQAPAEDVSRSDRPAEIRRRPEETDEQLAARQQRRARRLERLEQGRPERAEAGSDRRGSESDEQARRLRRRQRRQDARASTGEGASAGIRRRAEESDEEFAARVQRRQARQQARQSGSDD